MDPTEGEIKSLSLFSALSTSLSNVSLPSSDSRHFHQLSEYYFSWECADTVFKQHNGNCIFSSLATRLPFFSSLIFHPCCGFSLLFFIFGWRMSTSHTAEKIVRQTSKKGKGSENKSGMRKWCCDCFWSISGFSRIFRRDESPPPPFPRFIYLNVIGFAFITCYLILKFRIVKTNWDMRFKPIPERVLYLKSMWFKV